MIFFWSDICYIFACILVCKYIHTCIKKEIPKKLERRIGYIALLVIISWSTQLYSITLFSLYALTGALIITFIQKQQNQYHTMHTNISTQKNWEQIFFRNITSIQKSMHTDLHFCIGPEALLLDQLFTPCPMQIPISKNSLLLVLSSSVLDTKKPIIISTDGIIIGINADWYSVPGQHQSEQKKLAQEYDFFFISSIQHNKTYTITHQAQIHKSVSPTHTTNLLEQYIQQKSVTERYHEKNTRSSAHIQP